MPSALTIASSVVHGYVGNRAMVFPLQYCGWDVDALHTTNYSNHPGYGKFKGQRSTPEEIANIFAGLSGILSLKNDYDLLITGYTPTEEMLKEIFENVKTNIFQHEKSNLNRRGPVWVLDPVLGDNGKLYVLEGLIPVYGSILESGYVSLTTPNQFEFETLSGQKIDSFDDIKNAFSAFCSKYPKVPSIVISSVSIHDKLYSFGYHAGKIFYFDIDQINCGFFGCGDLFTGLISNAFYENGFQFNENVLSIALSKLNQVLQNTYEYELKKQDGCAFKVVQDLRLVALRAVYSREEKISAASFLN